mmetsp:Transcript_11948/g.33722  ORF Transcript_11948/g.33722 Transcript_11948/m.33722 type:complete len:240 (+) Transcript_11948:2643-3362(+)
MSNSRIAVTMASRSDSRGEACRPCRSSSLPKTSPPLDAATRSSSRSSSANVGGPAACQTHTPLLKNIMATSSSTAWASLHATTSLTCEQAAWNNVRPCKSGTGPRYVRYIASPQSTRYAVHSFAFVAASDPRTVAPRTRESRNSSMAVAMFLSLLSLLVRPCQRPRKECSTNHYNKQSPNCGPYRRKNRKTRRSLPDISFTENSSPALSSAITSSRFLESTPVVRSPSSTPEDRFPVRR